MKRAYNKPTATFIDYAYDVQVVAESSKLDSLGDGHQINYCTWESGSFANPCNTVLSNSNNANVPDMCTGFSPWSLRGL